VDLNKNGLKVPVAVIASLLTINFTVGWWLYTKLSSDVDKIRDDVSVIKVSVAKIEEHLKKEEK